MLSAIRMRLMSVSPQEVEFKFRGFPTTSPIKTSHLETIAKTFLTGYHKAIEALDASNVSQALETNVDKSLLGFAFEGAAMGFMLVDLLTPWKRDRLEQFVRHQAAPHHYMSIVGAGWAYARLQRRLTTPLDNIDHIFGWLVIDGFGFHHGFFDWKSCYQEQIVPTHLSPDARRVYDQGLGRALWFVAGADILRIQKMLNEFSSERHGDLWSGVGLAATYAGGVSSDEINLLRDVAGSFVANLAQGAVFAAAARERAVYTPPHTEMACRILSGLSTLEATRLVEAALELDLSQVIDMPAYQVVRLRIISKLGELQ